MKTKYTFLVLMLIFNFLSFNSAAQTQKGQDINGEAANDESGVSISMPDSNTVAIGSTQNDGNGTDAGHVRVYTWNGSTWTQKGADMDGEAAGDLSGSSISMSDANTVAIGAPFNDGNGNDSGHVRIYTWNGSTWIQKGIDINGEAANDQSGWSVSMPDANTVAIGAIRNDGNGTDAGHVRVYTWNGSTWMQKGADINGEAASDFFGRSVSMPNNFTVAVGANLNNNNGNDSGTVSVFSYNETIGIWIQKGMDIDGEAANDQSGWSVSMPDANTVAIGAIRNDGNGTDAGHVRVYTWNGSTWMQKGADMDGEGADDRSGSAVSMPDANTVAIGAPSNNGNGSSSGHVRIYTWNGSAWVQQNPDIDSEAAGDQSGASVSMPDPNTVAIGAPLNDSGGIDAGHVRIYEDLTLSTEDFTLNKINIKLYPNPVAEVLHINLKGQIIHKLSIFDANGSLIKSISKDSDNITSVNVSGLASGLYLLKVSTDQRELETKFLKK